MARSSTCWCSPKAPPCQSMASTRVVLPWSTCATIATLRRSLRVLDFSDESEVTAVELLRCRYRLLRSGSGAVYRPGRAFITIDQSGRRPTSPPPGQHIRTRNRYHQENVVQAGEVVRVGRVQGKARRRGDRSDHQVGNATARTPTTASYSRADPAERTGRLAIECGRIELILRALQHIGAPGALDTGSWVIAVDQMHTRGQLGQRDCADRHLRRQRLRVDPTAQDEDVGVEQAFRAVTGHSGRRRPAGTWHPDRRGK